MSVAKHASGSKISAGSCAAPMILQVLQQYSSEKTPLTQQEIIRHLHDDFGGNGIKAERKKVSRDIKRLQEAGFSIQYHGGYYLTREFEDSELRFLIDGVRSSVQISQKQGAELIEKLTTLGTPGLRRSTHGIAANNGTRSGLFWNADCIRQAIEQNKQISFVKCEYVYENGVQLKAAWDAPRRFSPLELAYLNGRYLLVAYIADKTTDAVGTPLFFDLHYVDTVKIVNARRQLPANYPDLDVRAMLKEHPFGLDGKTERVTLKLPRAAFHGFVETFGTDFRCLDSSDKKYITVTLRAGEADVRRFVLANAPDVQLLSPNALRDKVRKTADKLIKNSYKWEVPTLDRDKLVEKLRRVYVPNRVLHLHNIDLGDKTDALRQLKNVHGVDLSNNEMADLSFLADYQELRFLCLENEPATDLSFIAGLPNLGRLELRDMKPDSLAFLRDCKNLRLLTLFNCQMTDMPWYDMPNLRKLTINATDLRDVNLEKLRQASPALRINTESEEVLGLPVPRIVFAYEEKQTDASFGVQLMNYVFGQPKRMQTPAYADWLNGNKDFQREAESVCAELGINERRVLKGKLTGRSTAEIAEEIGLSCEAVETLYNNAVRLLQEPSRAKRLRPYLPEASPVVFKPKRTEP